MMRTPHRTVVLFAAFVLGAAVMAIELTASRLVAPHFGASMFVWTGLIVTVLLAMSLGYLAGGKASERGAGHEEAGWCAATAALVLFVGSHTIPRFAPSVIDVLTTGTASSVAIFGGALIVSFVSFAIPVFLLAAAGPLLLKVWTAKGDIGAASGSYFALSTVGSVLGTIAPTLWLVPTIGASATMDAVSVTLAGIAVLLLRGSGKVAIALVAVLCAVVAVTTAPPVDAATLEERESPYQRIRAYEQDGTRFLTFNEGAGIQSAYRPDGARTIAYTDALGLVPLARHDGAREHRALILGMAGGGVPRAYRAVSPEKAFTFTGVEVDPAVIDVARRWFALDEIGATVIEGDARTHLAQDDTTYDSIVIDAYSVQLYIPSHLVTSEFFDLVRKRVVPGGIAALNVNASSPDSPLLSALTNTVAHAFPHVMVMPVPDTWNYIVFASDEPLDPIAMVDQVPAPYADLTPGLLAAWSVTFDPATRLLTDDHAPIEFLTDTMILKETFR